MIKDETKIRKWLGDRYHLNVELTFLEDKTKIESWRLFRVYPNWMNDDSEAIMTSATHTDKELFEFARKHRKYNLSMVDNITFCVMAYINIFLVFLNVCISNKYVTGFICGIDLIIIVTCIVKGIFMRKNNKVSKLELKERLEYIFKKEKIKDERKNDIRESD